MLFLKKRNLKKAKDLFWGFFLYCVHVKIVSLCVAAKDILDAALI